MIENVKFKKKILSIIIRSNYKTDGIKFFTPNEFSQQLGYMNRPKGYVMEPHVHNIVNRQVNLTKEVLFIKSGKIRVDFYDGEKNYIESRILFKGDIILLASGGHGFVMLEPSEMIEVKQGPFVGDEDKSRFKSIDSDKIKLNE